MRKSFSFLLVLAIAGFTIALLNCGNDTHTTPFTSQFAYIQPSGVSAPLTMAQRHAQVEHRQQFFATRYRGPGGGIKPWTNGIANGTDSIVLMNNDGTGQTVIANQAGWFDAVQEAYDGKRGIAEALDENNNYQIYYVDLTDKKNPVVTQVTTTPEDRWSPQISWDGKTIVFVKYISGEGGQAMLISATGGTETQIPTTFNVSTPSFTPDGKILFEQEDNDSIQVMNIDGTSIKQLTNPDHVYFDEYPSMSSDGKMIVFSRYPANESGGEDIWVANSDGSSPKQLTTDGMSFDPMFVKDRIVFLSYKDTNSSLDVYSMKQDGTDQKRLTSDTVSEYFDSW